MKILILGQGGREHALAANLSEDKRVSVIFAYPGNDGMLSTNKIKLVQDNPGLNGLVEFAKNENMDLVVIGPENYLANGAVDLFQAAFIPVYGPAKKAALLESSKIHAKNFMKKYGIPTARFFEAYSLAESLKFLPDNGVVIKLSGLHSGKGVVVTDSRQEADEVLRGFSAQLKDGVLIEEKLTGREVSVFYACQDASFIYLGEACDHKRLLDGDKGPNTGGMGAYSPCPWLDSAVRARIESEILRPTLAGMIKEGTPFSGTLFLGLMVNASKRSQTSEPFLLEYNTRFGDPETQTMLPLLEGSLLDLFLAVANRDKNAFARTRLKFKPLKSVHVVKAAHGYPAAPRAGDEIDFKNPTDCFFAGVKSEAGKFHTNGGRILGVTGVGQNYAEARRTAYAALSQITFPGEQFRSDIAARLAPFTKKVAIMASGAGSNALKLLEKSKTLKNVTVRCIIVDQSDSALLENRTIQCSVIPIKKTKGMTKSEHEAKIINALKLHECEWVLLAGYMRLLSLEFIMNFRDDRLSHSRIVNIHPSLLPEFPGANAYEDAFIAGVKTSGVTIHFVDEGTDTGLVWRQHAFQRMPGDSLESFRERGKKIEWILYPQFLEWLDLL